MSVIVGMGRERIIIVVPRFFRGWESREDSLEDSVRTRSVSFEGSVSVKFIIVSSSGLWRRGREAKGQRFKGRTKFLEFKLRD